MEALRYLIKYFLKIALLFFLFAFIWWVIALFFPALSYSSLKSGAANNSTSTKVTGDGWLASPRRHTGLFGKRATPPDSNTNVFVAGNPYTSSGPYNGYTFTDQQEYSYTTYKYSHGADEITSTYEPSKREETPSSGAGGTIVTSAPTAQMQTAHSLTSNRNLFVRNLSIYEGGRVYTGLTFIGEAKSSMFREGKFPIIIVDQAGRVVGISAAVATTNWAVPGWARFEAKINYQLPNNTLCTMVFEEALTQAEKSRQPLRVPLPIRCN